MELGIPFGVIPAIKDWIERRLLLETYEASHKAYIARKSLGNVWSQVGPHLQYSVSLANAQFNNEASPAHRMAFRSTIDLHDVIIIVRGSSGTLQYEDVVYFSKMEADNTHIAKLVNIPPLSIHSGGDSISISLATLSVSLEHASNHEGTSIVKSPINDRVTPTYFSLLNDRTIHKFGRWWNLGAIDREKHEIFLESHTAYIWRPKFYRYHILRRILCALAFFLTGSQIAINIKFWIPIFFGRKFQTGELD